MSDSRLYSSASISLIVAFLGFGSISGRGDALKTYSYVGNFFDSYNNTAGPPSYGPTDFVTAALTVAEPLPPNLNLVDVSSYPGFGLTMSDGLQTLTWAPGACIFVAEVSTDQDGRLVAPWNLALHRNQLPFNGIATVDWPPYVFDFGALSNQSFPDYPNNPPDFGQNAGTPGIWTRSDVGAPILSCAPSTTLQSCNVGSITPLPFSITSRTISLAQLQSVGGDVSAPCGISSIKYQDSASGSCPNVVVTRTFTVTDECGQSASCAQTINLNRGTVSSGSGNTFLDASNIVGDPVSRVWEDIFPDWESSKDSRGLVTRFTFAEPLR